MKLLLMKKLVVLFVAVAATSFLGKVWGTGDAKAEMRSPSGDRYAYVHRGTYQRRTRSVLTTCYCYAVSYSAHVRGWVAVGRHYSWNRAVAARNRLSQSRRTCPGQCSRRMSMRRTNSGRVTNRMSAQCRAKYGRNYYWSQSRRLCVRQGGYVPPRTSSRGGTQVRPRGGSGSTGQRDCVRIYGLPCGN